jgi:hypothetical protein
LLFFFSFFQLISLPFFLPTMTTQEYHIISSKLFNFWAYRPSLHPSNLI